MQITDDLVLKVHIDERGLVWYLHGDRTPACSGMDQRGFMEDNLHRRIGRIRLAGTRTNAALICALYAAKQEGDLACVQVCSPMAIAGRAATASESLFRMRSWCAAPSQGGWHDVTSKECASYVLAALSQQERPSDANMVGSLRNHPVWRATSFIQHLDQLKLAHLISHIVDPRFYVDRRKPDSIAKLESFLGVSHAGKHERFKLALDAWGGRGRPLDCVAPSMFLWRLYDLAVQQKHANPAQVVTRVFIAFLRNTWLDALYPRPAWGEPLFVPKYFFRDKLEVEAFRIHMGKTTRSSA